MVTYQTLTTINFVSERAPSLNYEIVSYIYILYFGLYHDILLIYIKPTYFQCASSQATTLTNEVYSLLFFLPLDTKPSYWNGYIL